MSKRLSKLFSKLGEKSSNSSSNNVQLPSEGMSDPWAQRPCTAKEATFSAASGRWGGQLLDDDDCLEWTEPSAGDPSEVPVESQTSKALRQLNPDCARVVYGAGYVVFLGANNPEAGSDARGQVWRTGSPSAMSRPGYKFTLTRGSLEFVSQPDWLQNCRDAVIFLKPGGNTSPGPVLAAIENEICYFCHLEEERAVENIFPIDTSGYLCEAYPDRRPKSFPPKPLIRTDGEHIYLFSPLSERLQILVTDFVLMDVRFLYHPFQLGYKIKLADALGTLNGDPSSGQSVVVESQPLASRAVSRMLVQSQTGKGTSFLTNIVFTDSHLVICFGTGFAIIPDYRDVLRFVTYRPHDDTGARYFVTRAVICMFDFGSSLNDTRIQDITTHGHRLALTVRGRTGPPATVVVDARQFEAISEAEKRPPKILQTLVLKGTRDMEQANLNSWLHMSDQKLCWSGGTDNGQRYIKEWTFAE